MIKDPPHSGKALEDEAEALGVSVAELAKALGVTLRQLYRVINGDSGITAELAVRLEMVIGGSAEFWLRPRMNYDLAQIRNRPGKLELARLARPEVA